MSFWKNLFGSSKKAEGLEQGRKETQIIKEPEHDLSLAPPDDLMIIKDEEKEDNQEESNVSEDKKYNINNKDSP